MSTESGIPDFRSQGGLYSQQYEYPPETILSHEFFQSHTDKFYNFYRRKMIATHALPNSAHYYLARLERMGILKAIITQNIDNLHQMAGSSNVLELHGSVYRNYCVNCGAFYTVDKIINSQSVPRCDVCGGIIKPDVVLYNEPLNQRVWQSSLMAVAQADMLIVGGTSLTVYPATYIVDCYRGNRLVLINKSVTQYDYRANLCINQPIGQVFDLLSNAI